SGDNHRVDASPTPAAPQPPDHDPADGDRARPAADPQGVGPWNLPLTACPTPDMARPEPGPAVPARPAFEDGTLGKESPQLTGSSGEGPSQVPGPQDHGSVLKRRTGWVGAAERQSDRAGWVGAAERQSDRAGWVGAAERQSDRAGWVGAAERPAARAGRLRRLGTPVGILAAVTAAFGYVGTVDPNDPGHYPVCPLLRLTGVLCPGCGGLRSAHAFITGDLGTALSANAIATVGYVLFAAVWVLWLTRAWRGQPLRIALAPAWWWGVGAVLLVFTVVRNLPFGSALAP
ncbi:DUF2752 domain-containing protein, partial [Streptomyces griseus]|uniref:DUF2752 domain-containing protein n=1 Tax=Streptomyces griseus TaxID=1911 RepID=UPI003CE929EE